MRLDAGAEGGSGARAAARQGEDFAVIAKIWGRHLGVDTDRLDASSDFHELGGNSVLLLAMLADVCTLVVGAQGESEFMAQLVRIVLRPTLGLVHELAIAAREATTPRA